MSVQNNRGANERVSKGRFHDVDEVKAWAMARQQRAAFFQAKALRLKFLAQQRAESARAGSLAAGHQGHAAA